MSILSDVKDQLAISPDSTDFDSEILPLVNTAFFNLMQLGVGSALSVTAASEWSEYDCKPEVLETVKQKPLKSWKSDSNGTPTTIHRRWLNGNSK